MKQTLSSPTLAVLIKIAITRTMKEINTSLLAADLDRFITEESSKERLVQTVLRDARRAAQKGDKVAHRGLLAFAKEQTSGFRHPDELGPETLLIQLKEALLADGYDLQWEDPTIRRETGLGSWSEIHKGPVVFHIRPTEAPGTEMAEEISALEAQLKGAEFQVALIHYRQAVDNLNHHNYEASNGALRPMLEDVTFRVARKYGYTGASGGNAINFMVDQKKVVPEKWGRLMQGAWDISHPEGPHPGRSNADEARFRMLIITSIVRRLLQHAGL
ncbi:hypothetical protein LXH09_24720 [Streptomyces sp. CS7]|uniref:hypothetical protein n=1 Tax=Streptomyces TaxID=1883 RepID=UPI0021B49A1B|nr:hypothetical protein [Streptomyces sp. CS-7]MCT6779851.1 hypothetical protein [Streptomyces sp. CS-7]